MKKFVWLLDEKHSFPLKVKWSVPKLVQSYWLFFRFEISLDPDHVVEHFIEVVMRAKYGIMVNFKERSWTNKEIISW